MSNPAGSRRRPSVHITLQRAARLHRMVGFLAERPRTRDAILSRLGIGLRTFYRELDLLKRCGVKVRHRAKQYTLMATADRPRGGCRSPIRSSASRRWPSSPPAHATPASGSPSCSRP